MGVMVSGVTFCQLSRGASPTRDSLCSFYVEMNVNDALHVANEGTGGASLRGVGKHT